MGHETKLRRVGGSVMLAVPPAVLDEMGIGVESVVEMAVQKGRLVVEARRGKRRYTLAELLAQCDPKAPPGNDDGWLSAPRTGRELL
jgi:antitoxin ChpS